MAIDASIPLQVQGLKLPDPAEAYGRNLTLRNALLDNQQGQMKLSALQQSQAQAEQLRALLSDPNFNIRDPKQRMGLAKYGEQGMAVGKAFDEQRTSQLAQAKEIHGLLKSTAAFIMANPAMGAQAIAKLGEHTGEDMTDEIAEYNALPDDNAKRQWAAGHAVEADKMLPDFKQVDAGGSQRLGTVDPLTGNFTEKQRIAKTLSPDEASRLTREDDPSLMKQAIVDEAGNATVLDKRGNIIKRYDNLGKPSAVHEKAVNARAQMNMDLNRAIPELEAATKDNGLIDQSTGSGFGRMADVGARFVGTANPGDIAIGKLQPIADMALKMVPRFEGPQSDRDTQSYKEAAGQLADATLPREIRKAAGKEVLRLMKARKDQFMTIGLDGAPTPMAPAAPTATGGGASVSNW